MLLSTKYYNLLSNLPSNICPELIIADFKFISAVRNWMNVLKTAEHETFLCLDATNPLWSHHTKRSRDQNNAFQGCPSSNVKAYTQYHTTQLFPIRLSVKIPLH